MDALYRGGRGSLSLQGAGGVGGLLAEVKDGVPYFSAFDANGNVTEYVATNGTVAAHYAYSAFGETTAQSGNLAEDFTHRFSTKPWCGITGLSEYELRKYSPELGRWLNRDSIDDWGGLNIYAAVENNLHDISDYLGLVPQGNLPATAKNHSMVNCAGGALGDGTYIWPSEGASWKEVASEMGFGDFKQVESADECKNHCGKCRDAVVMYAPPDYPKSINVFSDPYQNVAPEGSGKVDMNNNRVFSVHFVKHFGNCGPSMQNKWFHIPEAQPIKPGVGSGTYLRPIVSNLSNASPDDLAKYIFDEKPSSIWCMCKEATK